MIALGIPPHVNRFLDEESPGGELTYWLVAKNRKGQEQWVGPVLVNVLRPTTLKAVPVPFSSSTTIRFVLGTAGDCRLEIFDLGGRLVSTLMSRELPAGPHAEVWDGNDDRGQHVARGIYFAKLLTRDGTKVQRLVYIH